MIEFTSQDSFTLLDNRRVFTFICPQDIPVSDLLGQQIKIDGKIYTCRGVERFVRQLGECIIKKGESIGIWVDIPQTDEELANFASKLAAAQKPLPAEFQKPFADMINDMYEYDEKN